MLVKLSINSVSIIGTVRIDAFSNAFFSFISTCAKFLSLQYAFKINKTKYKTAQILIKKNFILQFIIIDIH